MLKFLNILFLRSKLRINVDAVVVLIYIALFLRQKRNKKTKIAVKMPCVDCGRWKWQPTSSLCIVRTLVWHMFRRCSQIEHSSRVVSRKHQNGIYWRENEKRAWALLMTLLSIYRNIQFRCSTISFFVFHSRDFIGFDVCFTFSYTVPISTGNNCVWALIQEHW